VSVALIAGCCLAAPGSALAGVGLGMAPTFPTNSTVGDAGHAASLTITNLNTAPDAQATVCNAGDATPCPAGEEGITLIPSCGAQGAFSACTSGDPGVFRISSTATGAAGTACAGINFAVSQPVAGEPFGKVHFLPIGGAHVVLPTPGTSCRIDFTVDVVGVPDVDAQSMAGLQTIQVADATQWSNLGTTGSGRGSATGSTVNPPPPPPPPVAPPPPPPVAPPPPPPVGPSSVPTGTARISGRSGCVTRNFDVTVTGRQIRRVAFYIDGRLVRTLAKPNRGRKFVLPIRPGTMRRGTHRVVARTTFKPASGTRARSLRVVFQRCARAARAPRFTG
jgi:hypothetical protein